MGWLSKLVNGFKPFKTEQTPFSCEERINRGLAASRLLDDAIAQEVLDGIVQNMLLAFITSHVDDCEGRENIYRMVKALDSFRLQLETIRDDGTLAQKESEDKNKLKAING